MKNSDETLNQLLKSAGPVSPRRDFAQHIIAQADPQFHVQNQVEIQTPEDNIFKQIIRGLIFPKPGYALACSMLVGILLGWQSPELTELATGALTNTNIAINPATVEEDLSRLFLAEVSYYE
jgi:hypothetical protein